MLNGYAHKDRSREVLIMFQKMKSMDIMPNCFTLPIVLNACVNIDALRVGDEVHCFAIKTGFRSNTYVGNKLIEMYSKGAFIELAYKVFCEMVERNVVVWTSMISGYILNGDLVWARRLFDLSPERDLVLWNTMVSGYIENGNMVEASRTFDQMPYRDVMSWNAMLNGYANLGDTETCERVFEEMPERNVFSWNGLIKGYVRNEQFVEVWHAFRRMLDEGKVLPNGATLMLVLSACAKLGALDMGIWVHQSVKNLGYSGNLNVGNALIDMYAKCGGIDMAVEVFKSMEERDLISWNTVISGLAVHGHGSSALNLFQEMKNSGVQPDHITFVGVLCACTHMGLVEDGLAYFNSMFDDYSLMPQIEHCGCIVDLLSRAGLLTQAVEFVKKMPVEADTVIWTALLGASRVYKNVEVGELALEQLIKLEPKNPSNFVTLSNLYGDLGRREDAARLKVAMRDTGVKKVPGVSLIETKDGLVEFYSSGDKHPQSEEIHKILRGLTKLLRTLTCVPEFEEIEQAS